MNAEIGTDGIIHNIDIAYNNGDRVSFFVLLFCYRCYYHRVYPLRMVIYI